MAKDWQQISDVAQILSNHGLKYSLVANFGRKPIRFGEKKRYWYVMKQTANKKGTYTWVVFGDWKTGIKQYLCQPPEGGALPAKKLQLEIMKEMDGEVRQRKQQAELETRAIAQRRLELWEKLTAPTDYMLRKGIEDIISIDVSLKCYHGHTVIVPMTDSKGVVWGFQRIQPDSSKYYLEAQRVKGTYHLIPGDNDQPRVFVCEGYATGASIRLATGCPVMVLFSSTNMQASIQTISSRFHGKEIVIAADNDSHTTNNPGITTGKMVAKELNCPVIWPEFTNDQGKVSDFNDYHSLYGIDRLTDYIETQLQTAYENTDDVLGYQVVHKRSDEDEKLTPKEMAALVLREHALKFNEFGTLYIYDKPIWRIASDDEIKRLVSEYDAREFDTDRRRTDTLKEIKNAVFMRKIPWNSVAKNEIVAANGIYNLETEVLRPHRPGDYIDKSPDYEADFSKDCPIFQRVLNEWFIHDSEADRGEKKLAIQMFMGYCLMPHARYKKALICWGPSNTGKSLLAQVMETILGKNNCCSIPLEHMDCSRKIEPIQGKLLNIVMEPSHNSLFSDGGFKRLVSSGDEMVTIDPKHRTPYRYHPTTKHAIFTNVMPGISDSSDATYQRLLVINFTRQFTQQEQDPDLLEKLREEASGIMTWAVQGADILHSNNGRWPVIASSERTLAEHKADQNVAAQFVEEFCRTDINSAIPLMTLYRAYVQSKTFRSLPKKAFEEYLKTAEYSLVKMPDNDGKEKLMIRGLRLVNS